MSLKEFQQRSSRRTASLYKGKENSMNYATTLNMDQQGRIIIPAKVRKALQLHTGDVLMLEADTRNICLRKCDSHIPMDASTFYRSFHWHLLPFYMYFLSAGT